LDGGSAGRSEQLAGRFGVAAALGLTCLLGLRPYLYILPIWPTSRDAALWIARGLPSDPDWLRWIFATRHFNVGFRPVAALSYTLNYLVGGFSAAVYRLTDMGIHLACAVLVYLLYRRLAPRRPRWGGLLASALFVAHPVVEEVLPHLARRSYALSTMLGVAALLALCRSPVDDAGRQRPGGHWLRAVSGGALLAAAVLSNEIAYLIVPVALMLLLHGFGRHPEQRGQLVLAAGIPLLFVAGTLVLRLAVVQGLGGYPTEAGRLGPIVLATWHTLGWLAPLRAGPAAVPLWLWLAAPLVGLYYLYRAVWLPLTGRASADGWLPALLLLWLAGYTLLFAPFGVWFPRQVYTAVVPLSLLVGLLLAETVQRSQPRGWIRAMHLLPQLALIGWLLAFSPAVRGADPERRAAWVASDALLREMAGDLSSVAGPARVRLAIPHYRRPEVFALRARERVASRPPLSAWQPALWMQAVLGEGRVSVEPFLAFEQDPREAPRPPKQGVLNGRPAVVLSPERTYWLLSPDARSVSADGSLLVWLEPSVDPGATKTVIYLHDGERGRWIPLERRGTPITPTVHR
jgi:hypothetical protein